MWLETRAAVLPEGEGTDRLQITHAAIEVRGARLGEVVVGEAIAARKAEVLEAGEVAWRDLGELLVTPAWIDAHTHLAMGIFRGLDVEAQTGGNVVESLFFELEQRMTPEDVRAFARYGAFESLLHGVGLVWDHYYGGLALAEGLRDAGICAVVAPTLQDLHGPGADRWEDALMATFQLCQPEWTDAGIFAALGPHATDTVSDWLWKLIAEQAAMLNLPVHAHVAQSIEEVERSFERHGCTPVGLLQRLGLIGGDVKHAQWVHGIYTSHEDLQAIAEAGHHLCFCPSSQHIFNFPAPVWAWDAAGARWSVATDCAASNDSMNVQKELRALAALRTAPTHAHPAVHTFLDTGTLDDARAVDAARTAQHAHSAAWGDPHALLARVWSTPGSLYPDMTAGTIAEGALANLILWDRHHPAMWPGDRPLRALAMGDPSLAIHNVMIAGKWRGEDGDYHASITRSPEYAEARREASTRWAALSPIPPAPLPQET